MDRLKVAKAKSLRGMVIHQLYDFYGDDISIKTLKTVLAYSGYNSEKELKTAIYYLGGKHKQYITVIINAENYMDSLIWLTPLGVNLAEGDIEDVGVIKDE